MGTQGRYLSEETVYRIIQLLSTTDMTIHEIAERMSCGANAVGSVNRKFQIRQYEGLRSRWRISDPVPSFSETVGGEKVSNSFAKAAKKSAA